MTTLERIERLAPVIAKFAEMGAFGDAGALRELVRLELGAEDALDKNTNGFAAQPPEKILHIISANTAMAGMQTLIRGLILGSMNWCKIPSSGLPRFEAFVNTLPEELARLVEVSRFLPEKWQQIANAIVVFGTDETVEKFRREAGNHQIFAGYGNRWSGAVIFSDPDFESIVPLTRDICLYEQKGCLSAQIVWLHDSINAQEYGRRLADQMNQFVDGHPIPKLELSEAAAVARWRAAAEWKQLASGKGNHWFSQGEPTWGVVFPDDGLPGLSCLHRHVTLVTFEGKVDLGALRESVSSLGVSPDREANKARLTQSGASRICRVGEMQFPHPIWRQDGLPALGRLVRWVGL